MLFLLFEGFFFGGTLGLDTTMLLIELRFLYKKRGSVRHRLSDSNQPTVQALESLQWSQKAMFFVQNKGFHSALPFKQQPIEVLYSTWFQKGLKTLIFIHQKNILTKNCCSGATYRMDSQICITFGFVIPIFIYKMINNKIPAQFKSPFLDRNSIL